MTTAPIQTSTFRTALILILFMTATACGILLHFVTDPWLQSLCLRGLAIDSFLAAMLLVHEVRKTGERVADLRHQLQRIQVSGNPSARLIVVGEDEICAIATTINSLLASAEKGYRMADKDRRRMHAQALRFAGQVESLTMRCETSVSEWDGSMESPKSSSLYPGQALPNQDERASGSSTESLQLMLAKLQELEESTDTESEFEENLSRMQQ